jgi:pectinesterase
MDATRWCIGIGPGDWRGPWTITRPNIALIGAGADRTRLHGDRHAGGTGPNGRSYGTAGSATLAVFASGFSAEALAIENRFDYPGALARLAGDPVGANGLQAVALRLDAPATGARLREVALWGHQDTLLVDAVDVHFAHSLVAGSVDMVFGAGAVWFDGCHVLSRARPTREALHGFVCAPSTSINRDIGFVFRDCRFEREPGLPEGSVALARPWRPTRRFPDGEYGDPSAVGAACFIDSWMDTHVATSPWAPMGYRQRDGARVMLEPTQARFALRGARGPGGARLSNGLSAEAGGAAEAASAPWSPCPNPLR